MPIPDLNFLVPRYLLLQVVLFFLADFQANAQVKEKYRMDTLSLRKLPFSDGTLLSYSQGFLSFISSNNDSVAFVRVPEKLGSENKDRLWDSGQVFYFKIPPVPDTLQCKLNLVHPFGFDGADSWFVCDGGWRFIGQVTGAKYVNHEYLGSIPNRSGPEMEGLSIADSKVRIQGNWILVPMEVSPKSMDLYGFQRQPALAIWNWKTNETRWFGAFPETWFNKNRLNRKYAGFYGAISHSDSTLLLGKEGDPQLVRFRLNGLRLDSSSGIPEVLTKKEEWQPRYHKNRLGKVIQAYHKTEFKGIFPKPGVQGWVSLSESPDGCFELWYFNSELAFGQKLALSEVTGAYLGFDETGSRLVFQIQSPENQVKIGILRLD